VVLVVFVVVVELLDVVVVVVFVVVASGSVVVVVFVVVRVVVVVVDDVVFVVVVVVIATHCSLHIFQPDLPAEVSELHITTPSAWRPTLGLAVPLKCFSSPSSAPQGSTDNLS